MYRSNRSRGPEEVEGNDYLSQNYKVCRKNETEKRQRKRFKVKGCKMIRKTPKRHRVVTVRWKVTENRHGRLRDPQQPKRVTLRTQIMDTKVC